VNRGIQFHDSGNLSVHETARARSCCIILNTKLIIFKFNYQITNIVQFFKTLKTNV
jgi:hypothetical protein